MHRTATSTDSKQPARCTTIYARIGHQAVNDSIVIRRCALTFVLFDTEGLIAALRPLALASCAAGGRLAAACPRDRAAERRVPVIAAAGAGRAERLSSASRQTFGRAVRGHPFVRVLARPNLLTSNCAARAGVMVFSGQPSRHFLGCKACSRRPSTCMVHPCSLTASAPCAAQPARLNSCERRAPVQADKIRFLPAGLSLKLGERVLVSGGWHTAEQACACTA